MTSSSGRIRRRPWQHPLIRGRQLRAVRLGHHRRFHQSRHPSGHRRDDILVGDSAPNDMVGGLGNDVLSATAAPTGCAAARATTRWSSPTPTSCASPVATASIRSRSPAHHHGGCRLPPDRRHRSVRLANAATTLILGANASHAIDALQVAIDGAAVTNAAVNIDATFLRRALSVNLANDAANVILRGGGGNDTLVGGKGDDFFDGGGGADAITGGGGQRHGQLQPRLRLSGRRQS